MERLSELPVKFQNSGGEMVLVKIERKMNNFETEIRGSSDVLGFTST